MSLNSSLNITMIFSHAEPVCYVDMTHSHKASVVLDYKYSHKICQRGSVNNIIAAGLTETKLLVYPITTNKRANTAQSVRKLCNILEKKEYNQ